MDLTLVSHALCPYVQRAAIVLAEKGVPFGRRDIDLAAKPAWFLAASPLGKTPVLLAGGEPVFESAVICEYLDDTHAPRLHPDDPLKRARERGWVEFGSALLAAIGGFYSAPDAFALATRRADIAARLAQLEAACDPHGPWFAGQRFGMVDAAVAPAFRYFDTFESLGEADWCEGLPRVRAWRAALAARPSVRGAVALEYPQLLRRFIAARGSALSARVPA